MAPPHQGSGATPELAAAAALKATDMHQHYHERKLSSSTSFSSPTASPALSYASTTSTNYLPASNKLSCESIPYAGADYLAKLSSFSSTSSSYESFFHIEAPDDSESDFGGPGIGIGHAADAAADSSSEFLDFGDDDKPTTRPPAVQTMMPQAKRGKQKKAEGGAAADATAAYDPKRLPSSMFRTRSTNPAEWSATSNDSLFSIQLSNESDLYFDAAGFPRFPSLERDRDRDAAALRLPSGRSGSSGGLCVRHDCARCSSGNKTRKSVRFAATETGNVSGDRKHPVVVSTIEVEETTTETEATAASAATAPAEGWCELGCCLGSSSSPTAWWPRCCGGQRCGCHCKWWF